MNVKAISCNPKIGKVIVLIAVGVFIVSGCEKKTDPTKSAEPQEITTESDENNSLLSSSFSSKMQNEEDYWENISSSSSINDFRDYLNKFSENGKYATLAMTKIQDIEWATLKNKDSIKDYKRFLELYPDSPYRNDCCSQISALYTEYATRIKEDAKVMASVRVVPVSGLITYNDDSSINYPPGTTLTYEVEGDISATFNGRFITTLNDVSYFRSTSYDSIILMLIGDSKVIFQFLDYPELPDDENAAKWISLKYCTMESYVKGATEDASKGVQGGFDYLSTEIHPDTIPALQKLAKSTDDTISMSAKKTLETLAEVRKEVIK